MDFAKTRPFQIIFIAAFALIALGSLTLFATFKGNTPGAKIGSVVIWGTLPGDKLTPLLGSYASANKDYAKVTYQQHDALSFDTDLAQAIASGTGPDLLLISQEQLLGQESKLVVIPFSSLPQRTFLSNYVMESRLFLTSSGTYGVPFVVDPLVLYYNRDMLASVGATQPPSTWEAVIGLAPSLAQRSGTTILQSAIALGGYENVINARAIVSLLLFQSGSAITSVESGNIHSILSQQAASGNTYGTSPAEAALNFYTQFADPAKAVYSWNRSLPDSRQQFLAGDSALYVGFASEQPTLSASNPNLNFDMARIPQPQGAVAKTYGNLYAFAIPKASRNSAGAYATASVLSGSAFSSAAAHALSVAPALLSALTPSASDPYQAVFYPEALYAMGWLSPLPGTTDSIFSTMITSIQSGSASVRDALGKADQALGSAL